MTVLEFCSNNLLVKYSEKMFLFFSWLKLQHSHLLAMTHLKIESEVEKKKNYLEGKEDKEKKLYKLIFSPKVWCLLNKLYKI